MKIKNSEFEEVKIIENAYAYDMRGNFIKTFNEEEFLRLGLSTDFKETYYSTSQKDVIRGMHFQLPPYEHDKIIHVICGSVVDVVVDLRKESKKDDAKLNKKLDNHELSSLKRFLVGELTKIRDGVYVPSDSQRCLLHEAKREYNGLGGNSYVDEMFDDLVARGLL